MVTYNLMITAQEADNLVIIIVNMVVRVTLWLQRYEDSSSSA